MTPIVELAIRRLRDETRNAELRVSTERQTSPLGAHEIAVSSEGLLALSGLPDAYGAALSAMVFPQSLTAAWERARGFAEREGEDLHLRVLIDDPTGTLHSLRWELLRDPTTNQALAQQESGALARLVPPDSLHDPEPPMRPALRALVAVAGPSDIGRWSLAHVDVPAEADRALAALGEVKADLLAEGHARSTGRATLENLCDGLRAKPHLLFLTCHGKTTAAGSTLYLEDAAGTTMAISGLTLADEIKSLGPASLPLLAVLVACEGGSQADAPLTAIAPLLARAGIPAVVAMQTRVTMPAAAQFTARLLRELARDGRIDQALAAARKEMGDEWWAPILWLRPRDGRLWAEPQPHTLAGALARLRALPLDRIPDPAPLPPGSRMPFRRNPLFVGRAADLRALAAALSGGATVAIGQIAAATGLGGIGKTNLASEFVHRYGQFFAGGVCWLSCANPAAIPAEVAACGAAGLLNRPDWANLKPDTQVALVRAAWAEPLPRLLIFDNCDDTNAASAEELLAAWCPPTGGARVLVTSRRGVWDAGLGVTRCALGVLARVESVAFLRRFRPELSGAEADAIAATVGDLPLALHLSGSFLKAYPSVRPAAYLAELGRSLLAHAALEGRGAGRLPTDHERHVARTFALSYDRLDPVDPTDAAARALLARAACLAPGEPIPRELLLATLTRDGTDELTAEDGLRRLLALGLLDEEQGGALSLHRLLAAFVGQIARDAEAVTAVEQAIDDLLHRTVAASTANYLSLRALDIHLRAIGARALRQSKPHNASLCWRIGEYLRWADAYDEALRYLQVALALYRQVGASLGEATCLQAIGDVQQFRDDRDAALQSYQQALALFRQVGDHLGEANCLVGEGKLHLMKGEPEKAENLLQQAITIYRAIGDGWSIAAQTANYGWAHREMHQPEQARVYFARAADLFALINIEDRVQKYRQRASEE